MTRRRGTDAGRSGQKQAGRISKINKINKIN
ncbi:hypothetical protein K788_00033425 [Paraburkholderia caribensis MBA4]|uniref:Uncharacterized protein n=1 Tax=Paraburkholderia caribensis MBA4 TaxID=1323664 RepID=A0A0P0R8S2_9BURK|nr:hypothetical protein K788_00033425 [Paraburkholderia caribensis MBA4]